MTTDRRLERLARTSPGRSTTAWVAATAVWSLIALGAVSVAAPAARAQSAADRYELDRDRKQDRDRTFRRLSEGVLTMKKRSYASTADGLEIPSRRGLRPSVIGIGAIFVYADKSEKLQKHPIKSASQQSVIRHLPNRCRASRFLMGIYVRTVTG